MVVGHAPTGNKVLVESVDFGGVYAVSRIFLYLMPRRFFDIPRQTLKVRLPGLKPNNGAMKWSKKVGSRMRCFSFDNYWLDFLLLGPGTATRESTSSRDTTPSPTAPPKAERKKIKSQFDVIVVDRNDTEMDIYLDEVLVLETYAIPDERKFDAIARVKQQLKEALKDIPRPKNPFQK